MISRRNAEWVGRRWCYVQGAMLCSMRKPLKSMKLIRRRHWKRKTPTSQGMCSTKMGRLGEMKSTKGNSSSLYQRPFFLYLISHKRSGWNLWIRRGAKGKSGECLIWRKKQRLQRRGSNPKVMCFPLITKGKTLWQERNWGVIRETRNLGKRLWLHNWNMSKPLHRKDNMQKEHGLKKVKLWKTRQCPWPWTLQEIKG